METKEHFKKEARVVALNTSQRGEDEDWGRARSGHPETCCPIAQTPHMASVPGRSTMGTDGNSACSRVSRSELCWRQPKSSAGWPGRGDE